MTTWFPLRSLSTLAGCTALAACGGASTATPAPTVPATAAPAAGSPPGATGAAPSGASPAPTAKTIPPRVKGENPFKDVRLYANPYGNAATAAQAWEGTRPADAKLLQKIAAQPSGWWMGEWSGDIEAAAHNLGNATNSAGLVPVVVLYNVPNRDCGQYSKGGSVS